MRNTHQRLARNASTRPAIDHDDNEQLFDAERLDEELHQLDRERRKLARTAMYWLTRLANHRASTSSVTSDVAWKSVFDTKRMQADLACMDERVRHLAQRALLSVSAVVAIRRAMEPTKLSPLELKIRSLTLRIRAREQANEYARNREPELAYTLN